VIHKHWNESDKEIAKCSAVYMGDELL